MDLEASSRCSVLERMLIDENAEPTDLPLSLLEDITDRFSPDQEIGRGGFAVVYKGIVGKGVIAVKKLTKTISTVHENKFHTEVECLMKAKHKNIVRFLGYCADAHGIVADNEGKFIMANLLNWLLCFEYVPNGDLRKYITDASGGLGWKSRFRIIRGICEGLHYLHMNRILHLDLKPANILLDGHMMPKIADFGLSRYLNEEKTHDTTQHLSGTPGYMAPEFYGGKITFASDIYSLGVIIMEILTGVKGYPEDDNVIESWMNRLEGDTQLEQVRVCTEIGIKCTESDPKKRPVARCIIDMLDKTASAEENTDDWSSWEEQDAERTKEKNQGTSIFSSNSSVLDKLHIFKIFKRDALKKSMRDGDRLLRSVRGLMMFTKGEIKKITGNYSVLINKNAFGEVYKGTLPDYTIVSVKTKISATDEKEEYLNDFLRQVHIETQIIHPNILKLIGCCMEADAPISVHEFPAKGSLQDILHGNEYQMLPMDLRLDIAIGSAEGLRYMHSEGIKHGDVRPHTILLDERLTPKISNFIFAYMLNTDKSFADKVIGYISFLDPVFMKTRLLTKKSDVYSFGVLLLELITRKKNTDDCSLIVEYRKCCEIEKTGRAMFDEKIITAEKDILVLEEIGELAMECVKEDVEERPDMTEVTERLVILRRDRRLGKPRNRS